MWALWRRLPQVVREWKPELIHAHSPMLVGLPALRVAHAARLPLVYEVRDLWENASVDRGKFAADSPYYRAAQALEDQLFRYAQAVVTICESLRSEIAPRVRGALHVVPNAVDTSLFSPRPKSFEVASRWGLEGKRVVGYVGTFQPYEGLSTLIHALPKLLRQVGNAVLLITGGGGGQAELEQLTAEARLTDKVVFTGRVAHEQVLDIYAQADVLVYPRVSTRTTRITTPLKPLEAMAMGKPVIVSDLPAMRELVRPGETGLVFRAGDSDDLALTIGKLLADQELSARIGRAAREQVMAEREWGTVVERYLPIYEQALRAV
jgi:PEP-CTERM/exosortase A-associated glycosyltransferase